jgi:transposase InsO family protein
LPHLERIDYNTRRPHTSLGELTPTEFIAQYQKTSNSPSLAA